MKKKCLKICKWIKKFKNVATFLCLKKTQLVFSKVERWKKMEQRLTQKPIKKRKIYKGLKRILVLLKSSNIFAVLKFVDFL